MSNKKDGIRLERIYLRRKTVVGTPEEADVYIRIIAHHNVLLFWFDDEMHPMQFSRQSWDKIVKLMGEKKRYSISYIIFAKDKSDVDLALKYEVKNYLQNAVVIKNVHYNPYPKTCNKLMNPGIGKNDFLQFTKAFEK